MRLIGTGDQTMSKVPYFPFYPNDWLGDTQLQMASMVSKGIWITLLSRAWGAETRGVLEATKECFCKMVGCSADEFEQFLKDARRFKFAHLTEVDAPDGAVIRIECRRLIEVDEERTTWARQKTDQRQKSHSARAEAGDAPSVHPNVRELSTPMSTPSFISTFISIFISIFTFIFYGSKRKRFIFFGL